MKLIFRAIIFNVLCETRCRREKISSELKVTYKSSSQTKLEIKTNIQNHSLCFYSNQNRCEQCIFLNPILYTFRFLSTNLNKFNNNNYKWGIFTEFFLK